MSELDYYQYAYVTSDWRRAMAELSAQHGITKWMEMEQAEFATGDGRSAVAHFALAFRNGLQFEVIEPVSGDCEVYRAGLPETGYAKRFHHLGRHFSTRAAFDDAMAQARARYAVPVASETMGGEYAYFDAREETGHFIEYFIFPPDSHLSQVPVS